MNKEVIVKKEIHTIEDYSMCPSCGSKLIYKTTETYCSKCGLVVDDSPVDNEEDFEDMNGHKRVKRTGKPMEYIDGSGGNLRTPSTLIGFRRKKRK